jgi:large subunit ribosomal protein L4
MSASPLSFSDAKSKLNVELIENGIGTQALHETIVAYRANRRAGTHCVKTKATVAGSGKKPWRQKGTGNARSGYRSSPVWSGGGVVFGPHPRDYSKTKDLLAKLGDKLDKKISALIVLENADANLHLASRNHPGLETTTGDLVNAEQLLRYDRVLITDGAFSKISARLQK